MTRFDPSYAPAAGRFDAQFIGLHISTAPKPSAPNPPPLNLGLPTPLPKPAPSHPQLLDEFLSAVRRRYGNTTLIHFEDMGHDNGAKLLNMYRTDFPCYNDDLQVGGVLGLVKLNSLARLGLWLWLWVCFAWPSLVRLWPGLTRNLIWPRGSASRTL